MKFFIYLIVLISICKVGFAQPYLPLAAGNVNPLVNTLHIISDNILLSGITVTSSKRAIGGFTNGITDIYWGVNGILPNDLFSGSAPYSAVIGTASARPFQLATNNLIRQTIDSNGNIGIGTSIPTEKLSVNGKIRAHEVKVETANWPDFVFDNKYELKPLSEVEKYIQNNNHLPEIPSAKEISDQGINLGEMNALLLKKIEELTLYIIQQNKRIEKIESEKNK